VRPAHRGPVDRPGDITTRFVIMNDPATTPPSPPKGRYRKIAFPLMLLAVAGVSVHYATRALYRSFHEGQPAKQEKGDAALAIPDEELDLGRVWETDRHEHTVHITNLLDHPVTINRFVKTCDCLGITPGEGVSLQAHECKPFVLQLSLVSRAGAAQQSGGDLFQVGFAAHYSTNDQVEGGGMAFEGGNRPDPAVQSAGAPDRDEVGAPARAGPTAADRCKRRHRHD
jgi:hypothetical protein